MARSKPLIERKYHPYWDWEEIDYNMWGTVKDKSAYLKKAIEFTGDHKLYGRFMMRVANEWPMSCEHNLSNKTQNRKAWIGHAATALAIGCPEDITRSAWGHLTKEQQDKANEQAEIAIEYWESMQCQSED
jgi:hypothetical protein